jgi:N-methylhydantoinase B
MLKPVSDPITNEVLRNSLVSITSNMEYGMQRTAFSLVVRDLRDLACGIFSAPDKGLDLVACAAGVPVLTVVSHFGVRENVVEFGVEALRPGDELVFNDPFRGGNHCPDVTLARPVFDEEGLLAIVATRAHWVDVGGASPGSWPVGGTVRTIMEETTLRLPPMLLYREGVAVKSTHSLILDGTRAPELVLGDMRAQHTANLIGERELRRLVQRYGRQNVLEAMDYTLNYGEARMRAALRAVPDGVYDAEDLIDDDGVDEGPFPIRCRMTVRGDSAELDFSGTARQTVGNSSAVWGMSSACAIMSLKLIDPTLPLNAGMFRPIDLILPPGSMVHALPYHACADGNGTMSVRIASLMVRLVNQAMPERSSGDFYGTAATSNLGGPIDPRPGKPPIPWIFFYGAQSGFGATASNDGHSFSMMPLANVTDPSIEALEQDLPVVIIQREFTTDSGGPGRNRGGMGTTYRIGLLADAEMSNSDDRGRRGPFGVEGALGSHSIYIERSRGVAAAARGGSNIPPSPVSGTYQGETANDDRFFTAKFTGLRLCADDVLSKYIPGGGGWGDPLSRDPEQVARDVQNGLVSVQGAEADYGVVLTADFKVDQSATRAKRQGLAASNALGQRHGPATWTRRSLAAQDR